MRREAEALQLLNDSTFRQVPEMLEHFELVVNTVSMEEAVASEPKAA
jgi:hypothetical protein